MLDEVSWLAADGARTTVNAELRFADDGWPAQAELAIVGGALRGTTATLRREGEATAWALDISPDHIGAGIKTFEPEQAAPDTASA